MAGAEKIQQRILEEARQQAQSNTERAQKEAADMISAAREEAKAKKLSIMEKARIEASERQKRLIAVAELDGRKRRLQAKQELIDEVFNRAIDKLNLLPADQYERILVDMVVGSVRSGNEEVIVSARDQKRISPNFIAEINNRLIAKGIHGAVKLSEHTRDIQGGFILKDGNIETNNSFEAIVRMQRDSLEAEVVKILF